MDGEGPFSQGTPAPDLHLYSDASRSGWGAHLLDRVVSGVWSEQEKLLHINLLEMEALFLALQSFQELIVGRRVTAMCNNSTVVADGLLLSLLVGQPASEVDRESRCPPRCEVSTRAVQCSGRSPQPSGSGYRDRVVSPPTGGERFASSLGLTVDRSVRDESQREASPILFPCPGSPGSLRGCVSSSLGQPGPVRVSTLSSGRKGGGSSQRGSQSPHDSGRPPLAGEGVVRRPSTSTDPTSCGASVVGPVVVAAPLQQVPQRRSHAEPSRVATLQRLLRKSGFSRGSAVEMSGCIRTSTSRLYQAKWMLFCGWCRGRGVTPVNATVPMIVDFLVHLRRDKGLSISAVKSYRAALYSVLL